MATLLGALLGIMGAAALVQLLVLHRQRRLFLRDPQRRRFFLSYIQRHAVPENGAPRSDLIVALRLSTPDSAPASNGGAAEVTAPSSAAAPQTASGTYEAVVYVDATGECTFANRAARELLHWNTGNLALRDVLAGGRGESDALMESLARRGLVEQHPSALAGPTRAPLEISAVAVRDRDDNLWGAALFIRPAGAPGGPGNGRRALFRR